MYRFEQLEIWQAAVEYGKAVYLLSKQLPKDELFGLTSQIRRATVSISSNIAEGSGAATRIDFKRFLDIAIKSALETVSQLLFAVKLGYLNERDIKPIYEKSEILIKRIHAFKKRL